MYTYIHIHTHAMYILVFGFIIHTVKNCFFINTVSCQYFCSNS